MCMQLQAKKYYTNFWIYSRVVCLATAVGIIVESHFELRRQQKLLQLNAVAPEERQHFITAGLWLASNPCGSCQMCGPAQRVWMWVQAGLDCQEYRCGEHLRWRGEAKFRMWNVTASSGHSVGKDKSFRFWERPEEQSFGKGVCQNKCRFVPYI